MEVRFGVFGFLVSMGGVLNHGLGAEGGSGGMEKWILNCMVLARVPGYIGLYVNVIMIMI